MKTLYLKNLNDIKYDELILHNIEYININTNI